jgi:hypothetical protein
MLEILRNTIYNNGYRSSDVRSNTVWVFNEAGLICLNCMNNSSDSDDWNIDEDDEPQLDSLSKAKIDSTTRAKFADSFFMKD